MLEYMVTAKRVDGHGSTAACKSATLELDTDPAGRQDAFNPAELLLTALASCLIKGIERVAPVLHFSFRSVSVQVHGVRQDEPPLMTGIDYEITIDTDEPDRRLDLLHRNAIRYGTISNTLAKAVRIDGRLVRLVRP